MKITNEINQVGGGTLTSFEDAAIYLVNFSGASALVDAGSGRSVKKVLRNIKACGVSPEEIQYLLITHCHYDHTGGVAGLKEATQCQTVMHELDAQFLELLISLKADILCEGHFGVYQGKNQVEDFIRSFLQ